MEGDALKSRNGDQRSGRTPGPVCLILFQAVMIRLGIGETDLRTTVKGNLNVGDPTGITIDTMREEIEKGEDGRQGPADYDYR